MVSTSKKCEHPDGCNKFARGYPRLCASHGGGKRCKEELLLIGRVLLTIRHRYHRLGILCQMILVSMLFQIKISKITFCANI